VPVLPAPEPVPVVVSVVLDGEPGVAAGSEVLGAGVVTEPEPEADPLASGVVVVVGGDADGVRSGTGVSLVRSVLVSVHAVRVRPSARAQKPVTNLFMADVLPWCSWFVGNRQGESATPVPPRLTGCESFTTTAGATLAGAPKKERKMKLEGAHDVPAPRQKVWDAFLDPATLRQAIPGCEKLDALGNDEFKATMKVGVGGVKGTFEGKVRLTEKNPPDSYRMAVEGTGGPGFVRGETVITLSDTPEGTRVSYTADVQVGGLIASVGQRMLGGVSKMMADKFFNKMSELLQAA